MFRRAAEKTPIGTVNTEVTVTTQACQKSEGEQTHFAHIFDSAAAQGFLNHNSYETPALKSRAICSDHFMGACWQIGALPI